MKLEMKDDVDNVWLRIGVFAICDKSSSLPYKVVKNNKNT